MAYALGRVPHEQRTATIEDAESYLVSANCSPHPHDDDAL
jgi:hypothetical protein